ncbi:cysteine--tRNA ligase [Candidatus Woesearchaeota archaeon]|nr:MAG: cysteine--tRNA ligase [Candidatus Woesearchaeota archaeon]
MIKLYNTLSRKKENFSPLHKGSAGMYCCGPTVYYYAHIGNLRTYIFSDLLRRMLLYNKLKVKQVMNVTDVGHLTSDADEGEDKMEKAARREQRSVWDIAKFYTDAFFKDTKKLNIMDPDITCKATEHIPEMIALIQKLEKNGYTYVAEGNVYYDITKFKDYGKLAKLQQDELKAGARIAVDENKKNPHDFVLWFTKSKFQNHAMVWDSPWGKGYPGWHIECSAMSMKYLGEQFDMHCGGIDHIPVHHTNEIAQSEGATGKKSVNYWLHGEFLVLDKEKMAKSEGNILTISVLEEKGFDPLDFRYLCLNTHYRKQLQFNIEGLEGARNAFAALKRKIIELKEDASSKTKNITEDDKYKQQFLEAINDDVNIPQALAVLWTVLKDDDLSSDEKLALAFDFDNVFGLSLENIEEEKIDVPEEIMELVEKRQQARKEKDFSLADKLRAMIEKKGYSLDDTPQGIKIKKK